MSDTDQETKEEAFMYDGDSKGSTQSQSSSSLIMSYSLLDESLLSIH